MVLKIQPHSGDCTPVTSAPLSAETTANDAQRRKAIAFMLDAFDAAREAGIADTALSRAALFQSIMRMVEELGEEGAAKFLLTSAHGVERGFYTRQTSCGGTLN